MASTKANSKSYQYATKDQNAPEKQPATKEQLRKFAFDDELAIVLFDDKPAMPGASPTSHLIGSSPTLPPSPSPLATHSPMAAT